MTLRPKPCDFDHVTFNFDIWPWPLRPWTWTLELFLIFWKSQFLHFLSWPLWPFPDLDRGTLFLILHWNLECLLFWPWWPWPLNPSEMWWCLMPVPKFRSVSPLIQPAELKRTRKTDTHSWTGLKILHLPLKRGGGGEFIQLILDCDWRNQWVHNFPDC